MLTTNKNITTDISMNISGQSIVDGETVARYSAHVDPDEKGVIITTYILDKNKYKSDCAGDESEFEDDVFESEQQLMDRREEILGTFKDDESDDEPEDEQEEPDDESGDNGDKTGAGSEETIIP